MHIEQISRPRKNGKRSRKVLGAVVNADDRDEYDEREDIEMSWATEENEVSYLDEANVLADDGSTFMTPQAKWVLYRSGTMLLTSGQLLNLGSAKPGELWYSNHGESGSQGSCRSSYCRYVIQSHPESKESG